MKRTKLKPKKNSLIEVTKKYANKPEECFNFFFTMKYPVGFYCEKCGCIHYYIIHRHNVIQCKECGHQHYLFAGTIFQDNKLPLYTLILGLYLIFTSNKGISAIELSNQLEVNYKTALLLNRKCRILMSQSNSRKILDAAFYEADTAYIGAKSKEPNHQGCGTEQQPFLAILSTKKENSFPEYIKLHVIPVDNSDFMVNIIKKSARLSKDKLLNTDGKSTFSNLSEEITLKSEKINYDEKHHRLYWLNIMISNIKNNITGIYRGVAKRDMPLFLNEQQWRINHRYTGKEIMNKVKDYILLSSPMPKKSIITVLNLAEPHFNPLCV